MASKGVTISAACRWLGVSEKQLRTMMADGRLRYRRVNRRLGNSGHIVIDARDINALRFPEVVQMTRKNSRARAIYRAQKPTEFLRSWTGQDHRPPSPPIDEHAPVVFTRRCRKASADHDT
jgi:hypothetical protein